MSTLKYWDTVSGSWKTLGGMPPDAPSDGNLYGRKNGAWSNVGAEFVRKTGDTMTGSLTISKGAAGADFYLDGNAGTYRTIYFRTAGKSRWAVLMDNTAESGGNAGSNFVISRWNDNGDWISDLVKMDRVNGTIATYGVLNCFSNVWVRAGASSYLSIDKAGTGGAVIQGTKADVTRWAMNLLNSADSFSISRHNASGGWLNDVFVAPADGSYVSIGPVNGLAYFKPGELNLSSNVNLPAWGASVTCAVSGTSWSSWNGQDGRPFLQTSSDPGDKAIWWLRHAVSGVGYNVAVGVYGGGTFTAALLRHYVNNWAFDFDGNGVAAKSSGAGQWAAISDERVKNVYEDYTPGLAELLQIKAKWYAYKDRPEIRRVSPIAQEVRAVMPELVTEGRVEIGDIKLEDGLMFDPTNIQYAILNALREIDARLRALEGTP